MDELSKKIAEGNAAAINLVKTLLTTPTLINLDTAQGTPYALPLEIETHQQNCQSEVSTSLVICRQNKVNVTDNVAPGAYTWELSGYIPGMTGVKEVTNFWTPSVQLNTDIIRMWNKRGAVLAFKDIDGTIYKRVVIKSLSIAIQKDCRNKTPVKLTLQEINVMENALADITTTEAASTPTEGTLNGDAASAGSVMSEEGSVELLADAS